MSENSIAVAHTPGPWKIAHDRPMFGWWHIRQDPPNWNGQGYQAICSIPSERKGSHYGDMFAANARLIAAAPCLLTALQRLIAVDDAHATLHATDGDDVSRMIEHAEAHKFAREVLAKAAS
jgi:hypothetical protein